MLHKKLMTVLGAIVVLTMLLASCATPTPEKVVETVVVEKTVEKVVEKTVEKVVEKTVEKVVEKTVLVEKTPEVKTDPASIAAALPRKETLYFNGLQWGSVVCWNPYSSSCNNAMAIAAGANARVPMFETPYLYNMLDGKQYPLLADGAYQWNAARTELTFKIKKAAKWSDGTPVTADDVAYTWATHLKYNTGVGAGNKDYIETIEAKDPQTVVIKAKLDANGKAVNPLVVVDYVSSNYVIQKAWTQKLESRAGDDQTKFLSDVAEDVVYSGPYHKFYTDDTKVVLVRDDNYWGQDKSMWGKLPAPKYLAHTIFKDNAAGSVALAKGQPAVQLQRSSPVAQLWSAHLHLSA